MTEKFESLMHVLKSAVHGYALNDTNVDINEIKELAVKQGVWTVIFGKLFRAVSENMDSQTADLIAHTKQSMLYHVMVDIQRKEVIKKILQECREKNIQCLLLKGWQFSELYVDKNSRFSGDIDLFVREESEEEMIAILEKYSFACANRLPTKYHRDCTHNTLGTIELHIALYDDYCEKIWFHNVKADTENTTMFQTSDGYVFEVLNYTDNAIFNILHFMKHFLSNGVGLRQLTDVMLYIKFYKSRIDEEKVKRVLAQLNLDTIMDVCVQISVKYLGFAEDELICSGSEVTDALMDEVLSTIENGGIFGKQEKGLDQFYKTYTDILLKQQGENYQHYMKENIKRNGFFSLVFVSKEQMSDRYAYAKKHSFLLPLAWVHRGIHFVLSTLKMRKNIHNSAETEKKELLKKLHVIS